MAQLVPHTYNSWHSTDKFKMLDDFSITIPRSYKVYVDSFFPSITKQQNFELTECSPLTYLLMA